MIGPLWRTMVGRNRQPPEGSAPKAPWIILALSLGVTIAIAATSYFSARSRDVQRFANAAEGAHDRIVERLNTYIALLRSAEGLFAASGQVTRDEFHRYVARLNLQHTYPGIQGIGFAQRVLPEGLSPVEELARGSGVEGFHIWPRGDRPEFFPIVYLEPLDRRNRAALGFDMFSEQVRREAMERARDTGEPALSGRVTLVQEIDEKKQAGFLIYVPVYEGEEIPATVEERRQKIRGFVYAPFRADDLFANLFGTERAPRVGITVYDREPSAENLLHRDERSAQLVSTPPTFRRETRMMVAGRPWTVEVRTLPVFDAGVYRRLPLAVGVVGTLVSLILFAVSRSQARARQRADEERRVATTLTQVGLALGSELNPERLVQRVTDESVKLTGAAFGAYFHNIADEKGMYGLYTVSGAPRAEFEKLGPVRTTPLFAHTFSGQGTLRLDDVRTSPLYGKNPPHHGMPRGHLPVCSYLAVTVRSRSGEILGGLFLGHPEPARFRVEHEHLVEGLAAQMAVALDNARLYVEAREAVRHRDEFLSIASHELKTPLTPLSLRLELLADQARRAPESSFRGFVLSSVETARRQVHRLSRLVTDLLDVSRISAGRLTLQRGGDVDLAAIVREVVHRFEPQAQRVGSSFEVRGEEPLPGEWDAARVEQVVVNLVENAIKYGAGKPITLHLARQEDEAVLAVEDRGIGIDPARMPHVFDRFERAVSDRHYGGLGLGLFIARQIVDAHGGTISVESEPGRTVFTVTLPVKAPTASRAPAHTASRSQQAGAPP